MKEKRILSIFLSQFDFTSTKMEKIFEFLGDNASLKTFKKAKFPENILKHEEFAKMIPHAEEELIKTYQINLADRGIKITTRFDENFPKKLIDLPESPYILYYMGDLSIANIPSLSIVGTRKPTSYGRFVTEKFARDIASAGIAIISGLAYGVDSIAHRKCLEVGGKTIAVLGGGFDNIYPSDHKDLAMEIAEKGLLISEYRPKMKPAKYSFPSRNRIIAGLGDNVLITEASFKSGTIHTRDYALDYGKEVFAVPGNIDNVNSQLTNDIIRTHHSSCVIEPKDILDEYDVYLSKTPEIKELSFLDIELTDEEKIIIENLKKGISNIEELTKSAGISAKNMNRYLTTLEINGIISRLPNGQIALN